MKLEEYENSLKCADIFYKNKETVPGRLLLSYFGVSDNYIIYLDGIEKNMMELKSSIF